MPQVHYPRSTPANNPAAPDGGNGPGHSAANIRAQEDEGWAWGAAHWVWRLPGAAYHGARHLAHEAVEFTVRSEYVAEAVFASHHYVIGAIEARLKMDFEELKKAFIPGLLISLAILAVTTLAGAVAGGVIAGILSGGTAAVPAAAAGGELGWAAGMYILEWLGIALLINEVIHALPKILHEVVDAVSVAWHAGSVPSRPVETDIQKSAHLLSEAAADMVNVIIEGVLIWILSKSAIGKSGKLGKSIGDLTDPAVLARRGEEVIQELRAKPAEMEAALKEGAAELAANLRKAGSIARGLADFVEKRIVQIAENVSRRLRSLLKRGDKDGGGEGNQSRSKTPRIRGVSELDPTKIRFSQKTVSYLKRRPGGNYTYDDIVTSMKENGWSGDPVDVVRMPDGQLTSLDNTRIAAAREAGIDVEANVHDYNDPLEGQGTRFDDPEAGTFPTSWGQAVESRVQDQGSTFSSANPLGSFNVPRITGRP